jgi:NADH:ubiquinone oxidoreductase subunit 3 (subunit A)
LLTGFGILGIFLLGGFGFALMAILPNWLLRPRNPNREKEKTYECGLDTQGPTWIQFKAGYFMYALIFVAFDVETVFLYPWAVAFKSLGLFALVEMAIFISILAIGLWYAWKKGALEWK